ncbi:MAG: HAD-IA family hydrolase [Candidatus Saganbacteria bacterium]|nr:HAD-IA family hydrolase [Candidatus Saganbacteria bacterium]
MTRTKAIIFDFDGVIVESMDIKADGFAFLFKDYPDKTDKIVRFHLDHGGMGRMEKFERIYRDFLGQNITETEKVILSKKLTEFAYEKVVKCPFVAGAKEFLEKHKDDFLMFVVSGTPDSEIKKIAGKRKLSGYFKEVLGSPKKKTELNGYILKKYDLKPEETVFIGDSIDDYIGVKDLGIRFIGRIDKEDPFKGLEIESRIKDLSELESMVGKNV